jgi:hypothetical protein
LHSGAGWREIDRLRFSARAFTVMALLCAVCALGALVLNRDVGIALVIAAGAGWLAREARRDAKAARR